MAVTCKTAWTQRLSCLSLFIVAGMFSFARSRHVRHVGMDDAKCSL